MSLRAFSSSLGGVAECGSVLEVQLFFLYYECAGFFFGGGVFSRCEQASPFESGRLLLSNNVELYW
jgi:hypothetical protein